VQIALSRRLARGYDSVVDHGATFAESQLCFGSPPVTETDEPNLDLEELDSWPFPKIGEYIGMDGYDGEIWSVYTGSSAVRAAADPNSNPNVIWGTAIVSP